MGFIFSLLLGALAGFVAGKLTKGSGFGFWVNMVVGIIGGLLGAWVFSIIGFHADNIIGELITAVVGSCLFLWLISFIKR